MSDRPQFHELDWTRYLTALDYAELKKLWDERDQVAPVVPQRPMSPATDKPTPPASNSDELLKRAIALLEDCRGDMRCAQYPDGSCSWNPQCTECGRQQFLREFDFHALGQDQCDPDPPREVAPDRTPGRQDGQCSYWCGRSPHRPEFEDNDWGAFHVMNCGVSYCTESCYRSGGPDWPIVPDRTQQGGGR